MCVLVYLVSIFFLQVLHWVIDYCFSFTHGCGKIKKKEPLDKEHPLRSKGYKVSNMKEDFALVSCTVGRDKAFY